MAPIRPCETGSRRQRGFTLTELLVVLAIIGLLIAAIPILLQAALPGTRSLAAARALASDLRAARGEALVRGHSIAVRLDAGHQLYLVESQAHAHRLLHAIGFALPDKSVTESITFYPDGSSTGGEILVGDGGQHHRVRVDWLTGRVAIDD